MAHPTLFLQLPPQPSACLRPSFISDMPKRYDDNGAGPNSSFLSPHPHSQAPRRIPSKQSLNSRRSNASLRTNGLAQAIDDSASPSNAKHSLAHELAAALLPEPSKSSKSFAEEFGLEFDEGAEGIDGSTPHDSGYEGYDHHDEPDSRMQLGDELGQPPLVLEPDQDPALYDPEAFSAHAINGTADDFDPSFDSPGPPSSPGKRRHRDGGGGRRERERQREQDPMKILSQDLEYTEKFLSQLQHLDAESSPNPYSSHLSLEQIASNMISRINETARDREQQVRELLMYEREFKKIAGEIGGDDAMGQLDELERVEGLVLSEPERLPLSRANSLVTNKPAHARHNSTNSLKHSPRLPREWDPRSQNSYDDEEQLYSDSDQPTPSKETFTIPSPPPIIDPLTPAQTIPQLSHLRTYTSTLVSSLTNISEQVQVNGAATSEAGRKIRALKNKLGGWRTDWDSAERSRQKIEKWEAERKEASMSSFSASASLATLRNQNIDGRLVVEDHLRESQRALDEATARIRVIMATS